MKLRAIEIVGFKSFRDRVRLDISDGMTCIVGPNGCGKSNVVDAIKWTMGDMSPKSLRGDSMQDVIFAGTEKRKASGMAEVTLTFENRAPRLPGVEEISEGSALQEKSALEGKESGLAESSSDAWELGKSIPREFQSLTEISITRRLHRSGESEYLINKVPCRLRDIQNLLAGTGLGKQGYSIIEQGQIGFIVNARPEERRLIIEEASGITRYKDQRQRSERKLERTEQNLERTRDILKEIEKQLHTLKSQAEKAKEHKELSAELRGLEIALLLAKRHEAAASGAELKRQLNDAGKTLTLVKEKQEKAEASLKNSRVTAHQAERRHADLTENYYRVETRLNLTRSNHEHTGETAEQARQRQEELEKDRVAQLERRTHIAAELVRVEEELRSMQSVPDDGAELVKETEARLAQLKKGRSELVRERDEARRLVDKTRGELRRLEDRARWISEHLEGLKERQAAGTTAQKNLAEEAEDIDRAVSRLTMDYERANADIEVHRREVERLSGDLEKVKAFVEEFSEEEALLARQKVELQTRFESLEAIQSRGEGYADGVRRVLEWAKEQERDDVLGPAGDFLKVPAGQEAAYAAFLGDRLGDIVVRSRDTALEALQLLSEEQIGRVGCFSVGDDDPVEALKGWLKGLEIVEDLSAVQIDESGKIRAWATLKGDILFAEGRIIGGGVGEQAETVLRQARELEDLRASLKDIAARHQSALEELEVGREDLEIVDEELARARELFQEATHRARGVSQERDGELRERARLQQRLDALSHEEEGLKKRFNDLEGELSTLGKEREALAGALPGYEGALVGQDEQVLTFDKEIEEIGARLTDQKVEVAQVFERRRHLEESVERLTANVEQATAQLERIASESTAQKERESDALLKADVLAKEVAQLEADHKKVGQELKDARTALEEAAERVRTLELTMLARRQDVEEAQDALQKLELASRESEWAMEQVDEQLKERFDVDLEAAQKLVLGVKLPAAERKARAEFLKQRLRRIGAVNPLAIDEYEETKERHEFHAAQQADLEESVADLRRAIERMDLESRKRFSETFEAVNQKFQKVFPKLFRGGKARLILTNPKDLLNTGVDIEVQPPGKNLQNVTLLSGGEKALTAVSLIFSIFLLKPTPFAVLDEVDAPLDDANVGRFAEMVSNLSESSQMIVITHNRRTMEAPQRLYGVTMEEAGISKIVSVKLSDGDRLAS